MCYYTISPSTRKHLAITRFSTNTFLYLPTFKPWNNVTAEYRSAFSHILRTNNGYCWLWQSISSFSYHNEIDRGFRFINKLVCYYAESSIVVRLWQANLRCTTLTICPKVRQLFLPHRLHCRLVLRLYLGSGALPHQYLCTIYRVVFLYLKHIVCQRWTL